MKLNKTIIATLTCPPEVADGRFYFDDSLDCFGIRVYPSGKKVYFVRATIRGRRRRIKIGGDDVMGVETARTRARVILGEISAGKDPAEELRAAKVGGKTFKDLVDRYMLAEQGYLRLKPETQRDYKHFIKAYFMPAFGRRELVTIRRADVEALMAKFRRTKSARTGRERSGGWTNRMLATLERMFNLANQWELCQHNPCKGIERFQEVSRDRIATPEEIGRILAEIDKEPGVYHRALFKVLWLTMARLSEVRLLQWDQLDLDAGLARLPLTKAGRPFVLRLPPAAVELLKELPKIDGNPYVFPGWRKGQVVVGVRRIWLRICERAKVSGLHIHDIRRSGASLMIMSGASLQEVAVMLNHSQLSTTQRYARLTDGFRAKSIAAHQERLMALASASPSLKPEQNGV